MSSQLFTPVEKTVNAKSHLESELQAFLEAFHLLEAGVLPAEILKKIA